MRTANREFSCTDLFMNKSLDEHVNNVHKLITKNCAWSNKSLLIGMFGYDNLAMSVGYVFRNCPNMLNRDLVAAYAHKGWAENYIYWRDNKPWVSSKIFKKPHNPLNDSRRNKLAVTKFSDLTGEDRETNIVIANYITGLFVTKEHIRTPITKFL